MEFFGREEELLSLRGWLETAARRVTSQMLAVTGRHGAGKTRLLAEDFAAESRFGRPRGGSAAFCRPLPPPHEKPCVLIIDECEKLDGLVVNLWGRLQAFWDLNKDCTRMLLVFSARISPWGIPTTKRSCLPG